MNRENETIDEKELKIMNRWLLTILTLILSLGAFSFGARADDLKVQCGDMEFQYTRERGVHLSVSGIPVIRESSLWVMKPAWVSRIYGARENPGLLDNATVEPYQGGKKITIQHTLPAEFPCPFQGKQTFILLPDNTFTTTLEYELTKDEPAIVEWTVARLSAIPLIGCEYVAGDGKTTTRGRIPVNPLGSRPDEAMVARDFKNVKIDSRIGPMEMESDSGSDMVFFDYRANKWVKHNELVFWLGYLDRNIVKGRKYRDSVTLRFSPRLAETTDASAIRCETIPAQKLKDAQAPNWDKDFIIPTPKQLKYTAAQLPLSSKTKIYIGENPSKEFKNALAFLLEDLRGLYKIEPKVIAQEPRRGRAPKNSILLGEPSRFALPGRLCSEKGLALPSHDDGYCLRVTDRTAAVAANNEKGLFYGLTTLLQLVGGNRKGIYLKGAEIVDYPALDFRGVHCLSGKGAGDEIAKALRTLMARFKMNSLVWECEYIVWDSCPELEHPQYGMQKEDARKVLQAAHDNFIEITPLVQSLGHSEWIFTGDQNLDIAEDPEAPYAYCPTNPRTYEFIFSVYQEALDLFQPRAFHIGHDEVTMRGRFPYRSLSSGKSTTELVLEDIARLHDWFAERDVQIMLWGDMFLAPGEAPDACFAPDLEEAQLRRSQLPPDVIITDWHYAPADPEEYKSIYLWTDLDFSTIGSGWYTPKNIRALSQACVRAGAEGYLQTTWAGFNFKIDNNEEAWHQYWSYILAAEYAWSGSNVPVRDLPFEPEEVFYDLWSERKPVLKSRPGFFLDLRPLANRSLKDNAEGSGWLGYGPEFDFSAFPTGETILAQTQFRVRENARGQAAVLLAGKMNPQGEFPTQVTLKIKPRRAGELHFLMNTAFKTGEGTEVGEITIEFADGVKDRVNLIYGKNIFALTERQIGKHTRKAWDGKTGSGARIRIWDLLWKNPEPKKKIASITLKSKGTEAAPILLAITGVE